MFTFETFPCNGQRIHTALAGPDDGPVMLMLHGFPEYWAAWADVAPFLAQNYRLALPDQRGFNRSSKPAQVSAYDTKHLVADMVDLLDHISPHEPVVLCGHDWGASVAYALAMRHPGRVSRLIIANGVHPVCFQEALYGDMDQRKASQYMNVLGDARMVEAMAANNFSKTFSMLEKFSSAPWLTAKKRAAYREAWARDDALRSMMFWYAASPMEVKGMDEPPVTLTITDAVREKYAVTMPHLLIWGVDDTALLASARASLAQFAPDLTVVELEAASHWLLHEKPEQVAGLIRAFMNANAQ